MLVQQQTVRPRWMRRVVLAFLYSLTLVGLGWWSGYSQGTQEAVVISRRELEESLPPTEYVVPTTTTTTIDPVDELVEEVWGRVGF